MTGGLTEAPNSRDIVLERDSGKCLHLTKCAARYRGQPVCSAKVTYGFTARNH